MMGFHTYKIIGQTYLTPYCKITNDKTLNGDYEIIIGWFKWGFAIAWN